MKTVIKTTYTINIEPRFVVFKALRGDTWFSRIIFSGDLFSIQAQSQTKNVIVVRS